MESETEGRCVLPKLYSELAKVQWAIIWKTKYHHTETVQSRLSWIEKTRIQQNIASRSQNTVVAFQFPIVSGSICILWIELI